MNKILKNRSILKGQYGVILLIFGVNRDKVVAHTKWN